MTILTIDRKEFEKKVGNGKIYKWDNVHSFRIYPSDPLGSLDDFFWRFF